jgi:hypothetical protein
MSLINDFLFEPIEAWEQLPADIVLGDVAGIAVDSKDRVNSSTAATTLWWCWNGSAGS